LKMNEKFGYEVKRHLSDATSIATFMNPLYAGLETCVIGMSDPVSIKSRLINLGLLYGGLASLTKIRDYSKKLFGITKSSREIAKGIHDVLFVGAFVLGIKPMVYLAAGEGDWKKIVLGTLGGVVVAGGLAWPLGRFVDGYRELFGIEETGGLPEIIKKRSSKTKKTLAALITGAAAAATMAVYAFNGQ